MPVSAACPARMGDETVETKEPYLRWHLVSGGYIGQAEICVIASRAPDSDCYKELNRRVMDHLHEEAIREGLGREKRTVGLERA